MIISTIYGKFINFTDLYNYMIGHALSSIDIKVSFKGNSMSLKYSAVHLADIRKILKGDSL